MKYAWHSNKYYSVSSICYLYRMNYLAHAYLSFGFPDILVGNMISDFVKGKKKFDYPNKIQYGISLHRLIDEFTDLHMATREAKEIFRPHYRLYAGAIMDIVYDHFLARDKKEFSENGLHDFTIETYRSLDQFQHLFPDKFARMYPYMKLQNWLYNYRHKEGTERSLGGLVRRAKYLTESEMAYKLFINNYAYLENLYNRFFPEVKALSMDFIRQSPD